MDCVTNSNYLCPPLKSLRLSSSCIDEIRQENAAYEYLCHLEEARLWIETCIQEYLPHSTELETRLRNGVYLAKLGNFIAPHVVPLKKIFDIDQKIYESTGLHYRHTDNINHWILAMKAVGLPSYFYPNSFDVYGKKNMPKAIYCLHALNIYLHRCGKGMKILDLMGKIQFSSDEISSVANDFKQYGIQLPAFHKIGGILASEVSSNDATLHAAIIAINIAISHQNGEHLCAAMMNPNAQLENVVERYAEHYQQGLSKLKAVRAEEVKSKTATHKMELCWEFLPQKAIQEEINSVNRKCILDDLKNAASSNDKEVFIEILQSPLLDASDIVLENMEAYFFIFKQGLTSDTQSISNVAKVHHLITSINFDELKNVETNSALRNLNSILATDDYVSSFNALKSLSLDVHLHDFGKQFYHAQLEIIKENKGRPLTLNDLEEHLPRLTSLLDLNIAIIQGDADETYKALSKQEIICGMLYENLKEEYIASLKELNFESLITVDIVQKSVSEINLRYELNENEIASTKHVNEALSENDLSLLINSLIADPSILSVDSKHTQLYFHLLSESQLQKEDSRLSRADIQSQINQANKLVLEAEYYCAILASINMAVDNDDSNVLYDSLKILMDIETLCFGCKDKYLKALATEKKQKNLCGPGEDVCQRSWIKWEVLPRVDYFLNMITLENTWNIEDENFVSVFMTKDEITQAISKVQSECQCREHEKILVSFQAFARGYLVRKSISIKRRNARQMNLLRTYTPEQSVAAVKVQSFLRMSIIRKKYLELKSEKLRMEAAAKAIQRCWRAFKVFKNLSILAHSSNPPLPLMQNIIYMLETSNDDYYEEFKLHTIKGKAVQTIRYNQSLLKEIDEMDLKIGLLIRNRISLEDLLIQKKRASMRVKRKETSAADIKNRNFKLFSKNYNSLIESYENLLYVLQTKPEYLSRLIVSLPSNQATSFIESIIFSLYNYGSTPREEYLLLKMLCLTLNEEINLRGDDLSDIIKGENVIMKIIISFYRKSYWRDCLKSLLELLVTQVLNDKSSFHSVDPIEIYKVWHNELETQTGVKSSMPQDLTVDEALAQEEVNHRFDQYLDTLLNFSLTFCDAIVNGQDLIPYGIMFVCKFLKMSLLRKYPSSSTEQLYKIIGNFLYYRYINPAIIAPDVFDIILNQPTNLIADHKRMQLSAIAKFLHFAVTGRKYSEDTPHLMCLNPYLSDCNQKFVAFFNDVCSVKSLEEHFNIDMFSEALVQVPEVYMSLKELQTLHRMLMEREYDIAPDPNDLLHEIFEELKPEMLDIICGGSEEFLKTEVSLSLKSKNELEVDDESEEEKSFVETKFMVITLLQVLKDAEDVSELVERETTDEEEMKFEKICCLKQREKDFSRNWIIKSRDWKTLPDLQLALQYNLNFLELHGFVSRKNNYQDILNSIAKDIVNRWRYRISRKKEISKLLHIQKQLDQKTIYFLEKLDYYNRYIAVCLENMKIGKRNTTLFQCRSSAADQVLHHKTVKCSGSKLFEKGILIEIKDLETSQFKNVNFEISPTEDLGIFLIKAKFMGIPLETIEIDIQELLGRQYQGISEMTLFDCAKINNNLLLHFLNSKFYSKKVL